MTEYEITHGLSQDAPGPLEPVEVAKEPESLGTGWKPIASAPKDGTEILVFHPEGGVCAAFCPGEGFAWHCMDGMNTVIGKKSRQSIPAMTSFMEPPTHWMPLPAPPCSTCNDQGAVGNILTAEPCPDCTPAPTSHPIPTGATEDRDWELACDECNGSGHVFVKHQVAERKTDVQEFKEECEACEGRGFNIAFEDIPGIADYVKSCGSDAGVTGEDEQSAFERWLERTCPSGDVESVQRQWEASSDYAGFHAPAAGDVQGVPAEVMAALDRMCTPLDQSWLKGVTAEADAKCMQTIRDYILHRPACAPAAGDALKPDFERAEQIASEYVQDYEWRGEDVAGRDTCYTPSKRERAMITDAILGLLAEPEFIAAIAQQNGEA